MEAIILAGGENRRFQSHKALAEIKGRRIIEASTELLTKHFTAVYISTNTPEFFFYLGLPLVGDIVAQRGPISGNIHPLSSSAHRNCFSCRAICCSLNRKS